ncbi:MAG: TonB-dependent receptor [Ignavibacteriales bacterium]|nr:TonB-dependent receptor [Ignavibacteriales bacterium]
MKSFYRLSLVALFLVIGSLQLNAQVTTATVFGNVNDDKNAALPGVVIRAKHLPTGTVYGTTARENGSYNIYGLKPGGPYEVIASYAGKKTVELKGVNLELGQNLRLDFVMVETSLVTEEVLVLAKSDPIMTETKTGSAQTVATETIENLPTISRRFSDFSKLSPLFSGSDLSAAGKSSRYNNIQIDGTQYNDLFGLGSSGTPGGQAGTNPISLDAIQEFQVVVAPYDVKLSGFTGGGINAITRSGTNTFSGSIFGYGRNQSFVGKSPDALKTAYPDFTEYQIGGRIGGPIIKDRLFFFASAELTNYTRPYANTSLATGAAGISAYGDSISTIMSGKGYDAGSYGSVDLKRPSTKIFARLDFNLNENNRLTLRHNFVDGADDILANRNRNNYLTFGSYTYRLASITNSTVLQWNTTISNNMSNELIVGYTRIRDKRELPFAESPEIEIRQGGVTYTLGADRFSPANKLDQDIIEFTNNFTWNIGNHILTFGTHNEFYTFSNLFIRSFYGYYVFNSFEDFKNSKVGSYQRAFARSGDSYDNRPSADFSANQFGLYAQDEWQVNGALRLTVGVRVDIPTFPKTPAANDSVSKYFSGYSTSGVPDGKILFSPRAGFNLSLTEDRAAQLRGGLGIFTGKVPYVWISNNFANTGLLTAELSGGNGTVFSLDPRVQPKVGDPGTGAPNLQSEINMVDPNFKFPQLFRINAAYDQKLPWEFVGSLEVIYSKTLNEVMYEKLNIRNYSTPTAIASELNRPVYGGTDSKSSNFRDVLSLKNTSEGYQMNFAIQFQRYVARGLSINFGYTHGIAKDMNSTTSSQAVSQMRYNPVKGDPNNPELVTSLYEIKNRFFASVSYTHDFFANAPTTISLFYNGQSGAPFSFTVNGDLNNDGFDQNDLFYIPTAAELSSGAYQLGAVTGGAFVPSAAMYSQLESYIQNNEYLNSHRGTIAERNGARNPWRDIFDLRLAQDIPTVLNQKFTITLDILNVLNLMNSDWGYDESVFSTSNVVRMINRSVGGKPVYSFSAPTTNVPWAPSDINSRWAMQLGVRYTF